MNWNDLKFFLEVTRAKSLSAAARSLGVSTSTVSRRIEVIEADLKLKLFRHSRDGYDLTQAGFDMLGPAEAAEAHLRLLERAAHQQEGGLSGPVRIDVPELVGRDIILPGLHRLLTEHPGIQIDLRSSVRSVNLVGQESDIVLRLVRPDRGNYKIRLIGRIGFGIYGSPGYFERRAAGGGGEVLRDHRLIGWSEDLQYLTMAAWLKDLCPDLLPVMTLDTFGAQLEAVKLGYGVAVMPDFAARAHNLEEVPGIHPKLHVDLWLLTHSQVSSIPRVRLVVDLLERVLTALE